MGVAVALVAALAVVGPVPATEQPPPETGPLVLRAVPDEVWKVDDPGRLPTESWFFDLVVTDPAGREDLRPVRLEIEARSGDRVRETVVLPEETLATLRRRSYTLEPDADALSLRRRFSLEEAFDLPVAFASRPVAWGIDHLLVRLDVEAPGGPVVRSELTVPVARYEPRTELVFPLAGPAILTQGMWNNGGHSGYANRFAIDAIGLDERYAPMAASADGDSDGGNETMAGWGREIRAPAAGRVVHARNDVPDNGPGADPRAAYSKLPDPLLAIAGNCVIIDHGTGEWSALMHLQQGSVGVAVGDTVEQGQVVGRLGNSGDSFGAHLHYQLQDGPELFVARSLPARFTDLGEIELVRGQYVEGR